MQISLKEAVDLLNKCSCVIIDEDIVVYPAIYPLDGNPEQLFMSLHTDIYSEPEPLYYRVKDNSTVLVIGSSMFLREVNETADDTQLTLLASMDLEKIIGKQNEINKQVS